MLMTKRIMLKKMPVKLIYKYLKFRRKNNIVLKNDLCIYFL